MNAIVVSASTKIAGDAFDEAIAKYMRNQYSVLIGKVTAEDVKMQIGTLIPGQDARMTVRGRDAKNGMPRELSITSAELVETLTALAEDIVGEILRLLETAAPELVGDIAKNGIVLTGGGSLLSGLDLYLSEQIGTQCTIADDPESCVAYGCGKSLAWINTMNEGPINIARKRIMRQK